MSYEQLGGGGGQDSRLHVSDTQPDSSIVTEGDLWSKTTSNELFRATDSSTFVSTEGGGADAVTAAGTLDSGRFVIGQGSKTVRTRNANLDANDNFLGVNSLSFTAPSTLTIASGDIAVTRNFHLVAGQSGVDDDLIGITGGTTGRELLIRPSLDSVTITVKHNGSAGAADNILLAGGLDYVMSNEEDTLSLYYDNSLDTNGAWIEVSRSVSTGAAHAMDGAEHTVGTQGDVVYAGAAGDWALLGAGTSGQVLGTLGAGADPAWINAAGGGDVTGAANLDDNTLIKGDGGAKGVQDSGVTLSDGDEMAGLTLDDFTNEIDADRLHVQVRNESGGTLTKGTPIYISGYSVGLDIVLVAKADSDGSGTMPAIGLIEEDIANNATGKCVTEGRLSGVVTNTFSVGDILYISTTAGVLTATKPTGATELIQSIGEVLRSHATLGIIEIEGAGRTNDVPNTVFPVDDASSDPLIDVDAAADGTEDSFARKDHQHPKHHAKYTDAEAITAVEGEATLVLAGDVTIDGAKSLSVDVINEKDAAAGVTIDGVLIKDSGVPEAVVTAHEAAIDHDALTNFVALEHVPVTDATSDPLVDGDAAADGSEATVARKDHVHPKHHSNEAAIEFIIDGGGSAITTGVKGYLEIPFACTIKAVRLLADQSGSIVVDIWKDTYANFPPLDADSITASAVPTITTAVKSEDATLTGWTTAVTKGDILGFNVDSITTHERVTVSLSIEKT